MGENSSIQWTHHTFNPWVGCQRVSPGCTNCYAEAYDRRVGGRPKAQRMLVSAAPSTSTHTPTERAFTPPRPNDHPTGSGGTSMTVGDK